jgi:lysophospholipase L1-like esterase
VSTTTTSTNAVTAGGILSPGSRYVALGGSFASGPGIPTQGSACGRSDHNYPHLVASRLNLRLVDVTCSGATTANVLDEPQGTHPPQIDAVTADTALVSITVGGNNIRYSSTTRACAWKLNCLAGLDQPTINAAVTDLPRHLEQLIGAVRERAPNAIVVLVTYPQVIPPEGAQCAKLAMSPTDAAFIRDLGQRLEDALFVVAKADNVVLADPYLVTPGHGPCAPAGQSWVAGVRARHGSPYHPTAAGHEEMAALVVAALQRY